MQVRYSCTFNMGLDISCSYLWLHSHPMQAICTACSPSHLFATIIFLLYRTRHSIAIYTLIQLERYSAKHTVLHSLTIHALLYHYPNQLTDTREVPNTLCLPLL